MMDFLLPDLPGTEEARGKDRAGTKGAEGRGKGEDRYANEELRRDSAEFVYLPPLSRTELRNYASALDNFEKAWDSAPHKRGLSS